MEERVSPPPPPPPPSWTPDIYVVQVPKDHIYRVPPPENARIAELYRNPPSKDIKRTRCCYVFLFVFIIFIVIGGLVLGGLFLVLSKANDPRFSVQRFLLNSSPKPRYHITLHVYNPNSKVGILYKEGGRVSLSLRRQKIASGDYPTFYQGHYNSTDFGVTLKHDSEGNLPKEVEKSIKNDKNKLHVTFSLNIQVPTQMKRGMLHRATEYDVTCQVTVDTLAKGTRILSQQCQTKLL